MARRKFSEKELPFVREKISYLTFKEWSEAEIAEELGITQQAVSYHLGKMDEELANRTAHNLEVVRQRQAASSKLRKKSAWKIHDSSDCPRTQLAALSVIGQADDQFNRLFHLDKIEPLNFREEESREQIDEELTEAVLELMAEEESEEEGGGTDGILPDSPTLPPCSTEGIAVGGSESDVEDESRPSSASKKKRLHDKTKK